MTLEEKKILRDMLTAEIAEEEEKGKKKVITYKEFMGKYLGKVVCFIGSEYGILHEIGKSGYFAEGARHMVYMTARPIPPEEIGIDGILSDEDWAKAPDWATWAGQDSFGNWGWFEKMPYRHDTGIKWALIGGSKFEPFEARPTSRFPLQRRPS